MRKFLSTLLAIIILFCSALFVFAANQSVQVSAVVGNINHAPIILSTLPASDPKLLASNKIQNYAIYFRDDERDPISYTITPANGGGFVSPISGTIQSTDYDTASGAYVHFTYLSPAVAPASNPTTVTVTLTDSGQNLVTKNIRLYIY